jgi:ankyrin repeat protein
MTRSKPTTVVDASIIAQKDQELARLTAELTLQAAETRALKERLSQLEQSKEDRKTRSPSPPPPYPAHATLPGRTTKPLHPHPALNPELNTLDAQGGFPLYGAAAGGHYESTKDLLERGADASMRTRFQWTALHWAVANEHPRVVELLLSYGADVNAVSDTGKTVLSMAKSEGMKEVLRAAGAK